MDEIAIAALLAAQSRPAGGMAAAAAPQLPRRTRRARRPQPVEVMDDPEVLLRLRDGLRELGHSATLPGHSGCLPGDWPGGPAGRQPE